MRCSYLKKKKGFVLFSLLDEADSALFLNRVGRKHLLTRKRRKRRKRRRNKPKKRAQVACLAVAKVVVMRLTQMMKTLLNEWPKDRSPKKQAKHGMCGAKAMAGRISISNTEIYLKIPS